MPSSSVTSFEPKASEWRRSHDHAVAIVVKSALLTRNVEQFGGKMDPYVVVGWCKRGTFEVDNVDGGGDDCERDNVVVVSRTQTDWNAHKEPRWDHECKYRYRGVGSGEVAVFSVYNDGHMGKAKLMGTARILVDDLIACGGDSNGNGNGDIDSDDAYHTLDLIWKGGEITGTLAVAARLVENDSAADRGGGVGGDDDDDGSGDAAWDGTPRTRVDRDMFLQPVKRLGVSGGTAPFFELVLARPGRGRSAGHYIGKDLSRAVDEIAFYEGILALKKKKKSLRRGAGDDDDGDADADADDPEGLARLLDFAFEYAGVLTAPEADVPDSEPDRELLVLRNLRDGRSTLRLLDLKMGQKTASAKWQGKSRIRATKQGMFDRTTNSFVEGYRLEGFDGRPDALASMDPLMDMEGQRTEKKEKKLRRLMLQGMTGSDIFMHFVDLHQGATEDDSSDLSQVYGGAELGEFVLHEIVRRLSQLAAACQVVKVPQKWVGSSVALGYDSGALPPRMNGEAPIRDGVIVNIFDWGRSELNTVAKESTMTAAERQDRQTFWGYYKGGVEHLAWVAAQTYLHRFGNARQWKDVTLTVYDFDAMTKDDSMGSVTVPVKDTPKTDAKLNKAGATLTFSISWRPCPEGSRLRGTWRVCIHKAEKLPNRDSVTVSDPYCMVTATSDDGRHSFEQVTCVVPNELNPVWEETLDLPIAASAGALEEALENGKPGLGRGDLYGMMRQQQEKNRSFMLTKSALKSASSLSSSGFREWSERLQS